MAFSTIFSTSTKGDQRRRRHRYSWNRLRSSVPGASQRNLAAYDYYLRGMACFNRRTKEAVGEALRLFYKAIELDPEFASAYGMAAWCYGWRKINNWIEDRSQEIAETRRLSRRAAELGPDDAVALSRGGHALAYVVGELDDATTFVDRALLGLRKLNRAGHDSDQHLLEVK
jgi:tetratricopeptide (TPR) repeat protein